MSILVLIICKRRHWNKIFTFLTIAIFLTTVVYVFRQNELILKDETPYSVKTVPPDKIYNFMVLVRSQFRDNSSTYCGGTLIRKNIVLTAAHCLKGALNIHTLLGTNNIVNHQSQSGQDSWESNIENTIIHDRYNNVTLDNDIALIVLNADLDLNDFIDIVELSAKKIYNVGDAAVVLGWGTFNFSLNDRLLEKQIESRICTRGRGPCHGDSGGPLLFNGVQIGIVSASDRSCSQPTKHTNLGYYWDWIQENIP